MRRAALLALLALAPAASAQGTALEAGRFAEGLILFGTVFLLAAAVGVLRFPDAYVRLHASTKLVTLGGIGIFGGAALAFAPVGAGERVLLVAGFFLLTAPLSGYMISRAAYLRGLAPAREDTSVDEWGALGVAEREVEEVEARARQMPNARDAEA